MAFTTGTATNYRNLLDQLDKFITNRHVATVAVNAGGSSYVAGDILTVAGGTVQGSMTAQIEVLTVDGGGAVLTVRVYNSGAYSVDPTTTANAVTGGTGTSATMDLTMDDTGWTQRIKNISSATGPIVCEGGSISNDGISYVQGDIVTLNDTGTAVSHAQFEVETVDGSGNVLTISLYDEGDYSTWPQGTFGVTGGTGTGLTISSDFIPTRDEYLWEGEGTGGNEVFIGARSGYDPASGQRSWDLAGFTGWSGSVWDNQAGISLGRNNFDQNQNIYGSVLLLSNSSMTYWIYATTRRVVVIVNISGNYQSAYLGLLDPFGTDSEIPYPLFICGSTDRFTENIGSSSLHVRGIADPTCFSQTNAGAGQFRDGDATWNKVFNGNYDGSDIENYEVDGYLVYPTADINQAGLADIDTFVIDDDPNWRQMIPLDKDATPEARFKPSPDSGGDIYFPIPCTVMRSEGVSTHKVIGEINGVFWVSAEDGMAAEDRIINGGRYFRVFQMGANSLSYAHFCIEEV